MPPPDHSDLVFQPAAPHADLGFEAAGPSTAEAVRAGAAQGLGMGFADEYYGGGRALAMKLADILGVEKHPEKLADLYRRERDAYRADDAAAAKAHPLAYGGAAVAGGLAPALIPGVGEAMGGKTLAGAMKAGAVMGAVNGLGNSEADLTKGDLGGAVKDTGLGGAMGAGAALVGHGIGTAVSKGAGWIADELEGLANKRAVGALKGTAGEVKTLIKEKQIDPLGDYLLRNQAVEGGDTIHDIIPKVKLLKAQAGDEYENALRGLDAQGVILPKAELAKRFDALGDEAAKKGPGAAPW